MNNLLCTFNLKTGWRVHKCAPFEGVGVQVIVVGDSKYLSIPSCSANVPGRFCNPRKLAIAHVREHFNLYRKP